MMSLIVTFLSLETIFISSTEISLENAAYFAPVKILVDFIAFLSFFIITDLQKVITVTNGVIIEI